MRYSDLLVENREIFISNLYKFSAPEEADRYKTRIIGLPCGEKNYDNVLSRFHGIPERDGRTDRQTDRQNCYINIASVLTRDKIAIFSQYLALS